MNLWCWRKSKSQSYYKGEVAEFVTIGQNRINNLKWRWYQRYEPGNTKVKVHLCSVAQLCLTLCNPMDCSLPGSSFMRFSRREYWYRLPLPSPRDLPSPGIAPTSPVSPALAGEFFTTELPGKPNPEGIVDNYGEICKDSSWREMDLIFNMFQELWHLN